MIWRRAPTFLPNIKLILAPLTEAQQQTYDKTGFLKELIFRTTPNTTKAEIKTFLEKAHNLEVETIHTINYEGKKKRSKTGFHRRTDYKKAYVSLKDPPSSQIAE